MKVISVYEELIALLRSQSKRIAQLDKGLGRIMDSSKDWESGSRGRKWAKYRKARRKRRQGKVLCLEE